MKIISLSKKAFENLKPLELSREIMNTEAEIFEYNFRGKEKVLKKLYITDGSSFANKLYTLEMLDVNRKYLPRSFCVPDYLCAINGHVCGFTVPKIDGTNLSTILNNPNVNYKEQIYYLKKIGEVLQQLDHIRKYTDLKDIYINDLHESNFMIDNYSKELRVIDLDSCKIGANDPAPARFLTRLSLLNISNKYKVNNDDNCYGHIIADRNSDLYCYCMIILNYLSGKSINKLSINDFYSFLNHMDIIGIDKEFIDVLYKIVNNCDNENPMNYLDAITEKQLIKTRMF